MINSTNIKSIRKIITLIAFLISCIGIDAQTKINGVVNADDGSSLPFCNVRVKSNNTNVVVTDLDGYFNIEAKKTDTLVFSFVGFQNQEYPVKKIKNGTLNIILKENSKLLDDVVVVGYGTLKREDLTGAIGSIKSKELEKIKSLTFEEQLANKMAGVQVVASEGGPDAGFKVKIRGGTSLMQLVTLCMFWTVFPFLGRQKILVKVTVLQVPYPLLILVT